MLSVLPPQMQELLEEIAEEDKLLPEEGCIIVILYILNLAIIHTKCEKTIKIILKKKLQEEMSMDETSYPELASPGYMSLTRAAEEEEEGSAA